MAVLVPEIWRGLDTSPRAISEWAFLRRSIGVTTLLLEILECRDWLLTCCCHQQEHMYMYLSLFTSKNLHAHTCKLMSELSLPIYPS